MNECNSLALSNEVRMYFTLRGSSYAPSIAFDSCVWPTPSLLGLIQRTISFVVIAKCITQETLLHSENIAFAISLSFRCMDS